MYTLQKIQAIKYILVLVLTSQLDDETAAFVVDTVNLRGIASDWTFGKIRSWLKECEDNDPLCG
jgi:hypothetical protein